MASTANSSSSFKYLGHTFEPIKAYVTEEEQEEMWRFIRECRGLHMEGMFHEDFYAAAGAKDHDLFLMNGEYRVIPCFRHFCLLD